tara:strand:- start:3025 stop:3327 length:303 start_codon:yes stop_codon:yes gene_type:complete
MSFRHDAIYKLYPEVVTSVDNKSYNSSGELVNVDEDAVAEKTAQLQADYDAKSYARAREAQYPSIQDVVVALAEKEEGNDTMWQEITAQRTKVKSDNPKP